MKNNNQTKTNSKGNAKEQLIGFILLGVLLLLIIWIICFLISSLGKGINTLSAFLKKFVSTADKVIIVAMITGGVSIIGVVISSVVAKIIDYRYKVKQYLYDKREVPYEQFINMVYTIMENTKNSTNKKISEQEMFRMVSEFSKGLTLWGSNRVVKKCLKYRKASLKGGSPEDLLLLEDIIYEMRKDVGLRKRMKDGDILSFFINDIENIIDKK